MRKNLLVLDIFPDKLTSFQQTKNILICVKENRYYKLFHEFIMNFMKM